MRGTRTTAALAIGLILLVAAGLRFSALDFGRGFRARPDENGVLLTLDLMRENVLGPSFVMYGGGYFYPAYALATVQRRGPSSHAAANGQVAGDRSTDARHDLLVLLRGWSALLSLLTVLVTYAAARRVGGRGASLLAAAIVVCVPLAVREAHFAKADTAAAFAAALTMLAVLRPSGARGQAAAIGCAAGLAVSTKVMIAVLPVALYRLAYPSDASTRIDRRALAIGGACLVGTVAVLGAPLLAAPLQAWAIVRQLGSALSTAAWLPGGMEVDGPLAYHVSVSLRHGCGLALALATFPAIGMCLLRAGAPRLVAVLVLCQWGMLLASPMVLARFFLPVVPALAVCIASAVEHGVRMIRAPRVRAAAAGGAAAVLLAAPLGGSIALVSRLGVDDTRALAGAFIAQHVPADARIVSWGAPPEPKPLGTSDYGRPPMGGRQVYKRLPPARWRQADIAYVVHHRYPLAYSSDPLPAVDGLELVAEFDPFDGVTRASVWEPLDAFYLPLSGFTGVVRPGPEVLIYRYRPG